MTVSCEAISSPSYSAETSSCSKPGTQMPSGPACPAPTFSTAIASSMPPSSESCFWKTCMRMCGWRPAASSSSFVELKYASL